MQDLELTIKHLETTDPIIATYIRKQATHHNPPKLPTPSSPDQYEIDICKTIVSQQISTKAATAVWKRLQPVLLDRQGDEQLLREQGLSRQKASYIAGIISENRNLTHLAALPDEDVITELTAYKGVGQWSAEMFLMFSLARPDVFSIGDLGLRSAVSQLYNVDRSNLSEIKAIADKWSPHKTIVSLYLWHMLD